MQNKEITIPVFMAPENSIALEDLGIDISSSYTLRECETNDYTFYNIDIVCAFKDPEDDDSPDYASVMVNGLSFVSPLSVSEVKHRIKAAFA